MQLRPEEEELHDSSSVHDCHMRGCLRGGRIVEVKSPLVLAPGPAALTEGLEAIAAAIHETAEAMEPVS